MIGEIGLIIGVDEEMKKLSSTLTTIQESEIWELPLDELRIFGCREVVELLEGIKYLGCLKAVVLFDLPKMECVPKALRRLSSSLRILDLYRLPQLSSLPERFGDLTSLVTLSVFECPKLHHFQI
ncbi:hypothetical protein MIMGU_mgv1a019535mg, partial [Erythranthe guttata]